MAGGARGYLPRDLLQAHSSQSIYSFRGADPGLFYRLAKLNNATIYELPINYRSSGNIIKAAAAVDRGPLAKKVKAVRPEGSVPRIIPTKDLQTEAEDIAEIVKEIGDPENTAVLVRCRFQAPPILSALRDAGIPYNTPNELCIENQPEVRQLLSFAGALDAESKDAENVLRIWLRDLSYAERKAILSRAKNNPAGIYGVVRDWRFSGLAKALPRGLGAFLEEVVKRFNMIEYWTSADPEEGESRAENIRTVVDLAKGIKGRPLDALSELKKTLSGSDDTGVRVSTIHGTKGLEWRHVVIAGFSGGLLPYESSKHKVDEEEERRLAYVAITRAADTLVMTSPRFAGDRPLGLCPYIADIRGIAGVR
ncbi:MAG: ATP-dependent helicase [Candidatus Methanomethyliaceae archaeon]